MSRMVASSSAGSPGFPQADFKSLLQRVLAELGEAHDAEVGALRRSLDTVRRQEPQEGNPSSVGENGLRVGHSTSLVVQEVGELSDTPPDPPKPMGTDISAPDQPFAGILPGAPADELGKSTPLRRKSELSPIGFKRASTRVSLGLEWAAVCGGNSVGQSDDHVSADKALKEAKDNGLLRTNSKPGVEVESVSSFSASSDGFARSTTPRWQWMHRTGWRDYKEEEMARLEKIFQGGESKARLKSGKQGHHPMEIFFADMLQHDAASRRVRSVRRLGPDPWWRRLCRFCLSIFRSLETGRPRMESFGEFYCSDASQHRTKDWPLDEQGNVFKPPHGARDEDESKMECKKRRAHGCKRIADSRGFIWLTMVMIVMNAIWIAIETDHNKARNLFEADLIFQVVENFFCTAFTVEMIVRFLSFVRKADVFFDALFVFDLLCTVSMIIEIWLIPFSTLLVQGEQDAASTPFGLLRLARLLRVTRIGRLVRIVPDLITLLKGLYRSLRPVMVSVFLLGILVLLFAIAFRSQVKGERLGQCCWAVESCRRCDGYFHSIPETVLTLLFNGTLLDNVKHVLDVVRLESSFLTVAFILYVFITHCAILNMLIGIIIGVVAEVKKAEKERTDKYQLMSCLWGIMEVYDKDGTKMLNKDEFDLFITNPEVKHVLAKFRVDVWGLRTFMDVYAASLSEDNLEELDEDPAFPFDEILDIVLRLRGGGGASVSDIVNLRRFTGLRLDNVESLVSELYHKKRKVTWSGSAGAM